MEIFRLIVEIFAGLAVIVGLVITLCKPIREKITKSKERDEANKAMFKGLSDEIKEVKAEVGEIMLGQESIKAQIKEDKALQARSKILRFADEIYERRKHSKEHFDEVLRQMDDYNEYCRTHPEFKNEQTVDAQQTIRDVYHKCKEEHSFLGDINY